MSLQYRKKSSSHNNTEQLDLYNAMIKKMIVDHTKEKWKSEMIYHALDKLSREFKESEIEANNILEDNSDERYLIITYGISISLIIGIMAYVIIWW